MKNNLITPEIIDGIICYAPKLSQINEHYPQEAFESFVLKEENHFWFQSRNICIRYLVKKYMDNNRVSEFLEIGCGTGYVLKGLSDYKFLKLMGAEIHLGGLKFAKERLPNTDFIQADVLEFPFINKFDSIGTFDVLEHITEDELAIKMVNRALKKNGKFFISVPQYKWMWSVTDDEAFHKRRYSKKDLRRKLETNNFSILYMGSFVFTLFPFMLISRLLNKRTKNENSKVATELDIHPYVNKIFRTLMRIDELLISRGVILPFGGSIFCVAEKKG